MSNQGIAGCRQGQSSWFSGQTAAWSLSLRQTEPGVSELLRSNDCVLIGYVEVLLRQLGISCMVADQHMSIIEGSIGAFPRRLLVDREDVPAARRALEEAGLGKWIYQPDQPS